MSDDWVGLLAGAELTAWQNASLQGSGRLPRMVRAPSLAESHQSLAAAYLLVPVLRTLHAVLPDVHVEAASVSIADHLHGDYWHDHRLIRVECHHRPVLVAWTLLHEFGHAVDHAALDDRLRQEVAEHLGLSTWRGRDERWERRGEEWYADAFARLWWPVHLRPAPLPWRVEARAPVAADEPLFDLPSLGLREPWWRRVLARR